MTWSARALLPTRFPERNAMKLRPAWRGSSSQWQRSFAFIDRSRRHERLFKWLIVVATLAVLVSIVTCIPWGRYLASSIRSAVRETTRKVMRVKPTRAQIDEQWADVRQRGIEITRSRVERQYALSSPALQRLLRYAGMDPEHGLLRWGNYNWTLLLPAKVFEPDDLGRSYRLRPSTHSIWLKEPFEPRQVPLFYLVPDEPGLRDVIQGTEVRVVETSRQTTNSWGLRGPEPDLNAGVRVIVLGDSYMQGMFVRDDETAPECLRRDLEQRLKARVSVLNTGVMGYSPEQYYFSLMAFADRFRPHLVVISICPNDFGNEWAATREGKGDWQEGKYWLDKIARYCQARHWPHLVVAAPYRPSLLEKRNEGYYPGSLPYILNEGFTFLNPSEEFINAHLKLVGAAERAGKTVRDSPVFNEALNDNHFSALGSEVWAAAVGRRLALLLDGEQTSNTQTAGVKP
jgi:lysophospholipase L1-like esterase